MIDKEKSKSYTGVSYYIGTCPECGRKDVGLYQKHGEHVMQKQGMKKRQERLCAGCIYNKK